MRQLFKLLDAETWTAAELREGLLAVRDWVPDTNDVPPLPDWLRERFAAVADFRLRDCATHPAGGLIIRSRAGAAGADEADLFADDDDQATEASEETRFDAHTADVVEAAKKLAIACLGESGAAALEAAAQWHDVGKLDPRFQAMLRGTVALPADVPLAKSPAQSRSHKQSLALRDAAGLPAGFRHEMLSLQLATRDRTGPLSTEEMDLLLHLIASHHGHARPFAPVCEDEAPPGITGHVAGLRVELDAESRRTLVAPHRLDSGVSDRFWGLVRRYGWWGLAYREAVLRLADWQASAHPSEANLETRP